MSLSVEVAVIGLIQAVLVALIGWLSIRDSRKRQKAESEALARAEQRALESRVIMGTITETFALSMATAKATLTGKANGDLATAIDSASVKSKELSKFILDAATTQRPK